MHPKQPVIRTFQNKSQNSETENRMVEIFERIFDQQENSQLYINCLNPKYEL